MCMHHCGPLRSAVKPPGDVYPRRMRRAWLYSAIAAAVACGTLKAADDGTSSSDDGGVDAAPDGMVAEGGVAEAGCTAEGGAMIALTFSGGGTYCVDRTEVTNDAYGAFLDAGLSFDAQAPECLWNNNWAPNCGDAATTRAQQPVVCVDWCDAFAYCKWRGKRLCGRMGAHGDNNAPADIANPVRSEWFSACSAGGLRRYAYGVTPKKGVCPADGVPVTDVGTNPDCIGGFDGLRELTGNVSEWEASCTASAAREDTCLARGGDVNDAFGDQPCDVSNPLRRDSRNDVVGFRCCADSL
jgi:sulfatase modifying factor 1